MNKTPHAQRGAALMVAMVMIFMISIMGISVMRNSSLEHRMASNSIQSAIAFQAAESVVEETLNNNASMTAAFTQVTGCTGDVVTWPVSLQGNAAPGLQTQAYIRFTRMAPLAEGYSSSFGNAMFVETLGKSQLPSARAESAIKRGAYRVVPAGPQGC